MQVTWHNLLPVRITTKEQEVHTRKIKHTCPHTLCCLAAFCHNTCCGVTCHRLLLFCIGLFIGVTYCRLYPSTAATTDSDDQGHKRHVAGEDLCLLEAWKGCISCLPSHKRISSTLGEWGYLPDREELVNLVVMKKSRMLAYQTSKELVKRYYKTSQDVVIVWWKILGIHPGN